MQLAKTIDLTAFLLRLQEQIGLSLVLAGSTGSSARHKIRSDEPAKDDTSSAPENCKRCRAMNAYDDKRGNGPELMLKISWSRAR